jgi:diguanylate cyclase (GGDEF)-like protein/PAS domain S-box-containing protein
MGWLTPLQQKNPFLYAPRPGALGLSLGLSWACCTLIGLCLFLLGPATLAAQEPPVRIGVLAHRGEALVMAAWQGHADYLNERLAPQRFEIIPLPFANREMTLAVERRAVDFIITNPGHYIELQLAGLATAIATRRVQGANGIIDSFGGALITPSQRTGINSYRDLRGKTLLTPSVHSLGAWQAPLREAMEQGLDLRAQTRVVQLNDHHAVIEALLRGEGDAGLIRSDILDDLVAQGRVQADALRVANPLPQPGYPHPLSTRLYPEWPLAMVKGTSRELAKSVLTALFALTADSPAARSAKISGWGIVGDYGSVLELFRDIGHGPFDSHQLSLKEVLLRYWLIFASIAAALLFILIFALLHVNASRKKLFEMQELLKKSQEISLVGSWLVDHRNHQLTISDQVYRLFGYEPGAFVATYQTYLQAIHPEDRERVEQAFLNAAKNNQAWEMVHRILRPDGSVRIVLEKSVNLVNERGEPIISTGSIQDITEQSENEHKLRLAANVFQHSAEGILITDADGLILDINAAFTQITGYRLREVQGKTPSILQSGRHDPEFYAGMWHALLERGFWKGVVWNRRKDGSEYAEQLTISAVRSGDQGARQYVGIFSDITEQLERQNHIEHLAHHDGLTGLPNRMLLQDRLKQAMAYCDRNQTLLAVVYMDLDGFKPVNDIHGHEAGDHLLMEIAFRLKNSLRAQDTVARLGGDEFVLLLGDIHSLDECEQAAQRIITLISSPISLGEIEVQVSASLGIALYPIIEGGGDTLLRNADQAMYVAKTSGKGRFHLFERQSDATTRTRHEERDRIELALQLGELALHYQPIVDMCSGRTLAAEALLRWQHPQDGLLLPERFLPVIESSETAVKLGYWVMQQAIDQLAAWRLQGLDISININVSACHLLDGDFIDQLQQILQQHPELPPFSISLEIQETAALDDISQVSNRVNRCRALGVGFALDDFGTGYSSLSYFRRLPMDCVKIDRSFVKDMLDDEDDLAIIEGIIGLSQAFQRRLVAEGVETPQHGVALLMLGCIHGQGFEIAPAMPAAQLPDWIHGYRPSPGWTDCLDQHWTRDDLPLLLVDQHHKNWIGRVEAYLKGEHSAEDHLLGLNHQQCRFGRWYQGIGTQLYSDLPEFIHLGEIHRDIHNLARGLIQQHGFGDLEGARQGLPELLAQRDRLIVQVGRLRERVKQLRSQP